MVESRRDLPHIYFSGIGKAEAYTSPLRPRSKAPLSRDREAHAQTLQAALGEAIARAQEELAVREPDLEEGERGYYLEFLVPAAEQAIVDSLESRRKGIELVAVHSSAEKPGQIAAAVFVPEDATEYFPRRIDDFRTRETPKGTPRHANLVTRLEHVSLAGVPSLFTDPPDQLPPPEEAVWWEIWLRKGRERSFRVIGERIGMKVQEGTLVFAERDVVLVFADQAQLARLIRNTDAVAELRLPKDTPSAFLELNAAEQAQWTADLLSRITPPDQGSVAVCLLDSGSNPEHPLLAPALDPADMHAYDPSWGEHDTGHQWQGHGTAMSGLALYGDLTPMLAGNDPVPLAHRLESVKILPDQGQNDPLLYGAISVEAVSRAEVQAPHRPRAVCLATTSAYETDRGRPSSWSASLDRLCCEEGAERLILISAGNLDPPIDPRGYPDRNDVEPIENPAQAWNTLTVGAYTNKVTLTDSTLTGWETVAPDGGLCPHSRTPVAWDGQWPIKPDIVLEGGNLAASPGGDGDTVDDLQLLTTWNNLPLGLFTTAWATSAATALAARMAARILAHRPSLGRRQFAPS